MGVLLRFMIPGGFVRVNVEDIKSGGRQVRFTGEDEWAKEAVQIALEGPVRDLTGELAIERRRKDVLVTGKGHAVVSRECDRCGQPTDIEVEVKEALSYRAAGSETYSGAQEIELSEKDLDVGWYEGGELDLNSIVCELFTLGLPSRVVCTREEDCDVLLSASPESESTGDEPVGHPAFAALKDLF